MKVLKQVYYFCLEHLEPILDSVSSRVCFFCRYNLGSLICDDCLQEELSLKRKSIDYKVLDHYFLSHEQVFHPKIFYLFNFFKKTSYLIKKAKYTRPYFAKFFTKLQSKLFIKKINSIFNDDFNECFMQDIALADESLKIFITYVPMHKLKEEERSFNFSKLLAKDIFYKLQELIKAPQLVLYQNVNGLKKYQLSQVEFLPDFFLRVKDTKPLFNLGQESRIKELEASFVINENLIIKKSGLNILLIIDDICTTGSTLMELMKLTRLKADFDDQIGFSIYGRNLK